MIINKGVSIIIPIYNTHVSYIEEAVTSVLSQKIIGYNIEVVIVDDCSDNQDTNLKLTELSKNNKITIIYLESNGGPARARNIGVKAAKYDLIAFLDADDIWLNNSLQCRLKEFECDPSINCVTSLYLYLYKDTLKEGETYKLNMLSKSIQVHTKKLLKKPDTQYFELTPFNLGTSIFKREKYLSIGGLNESLYIGEDWLFWLMFSESNKILFLPEVTMHVRRQCTSLMSGNKMTSFAVIQAEIHAFFTLKGSKNKKYCYWRLLSNLNALIDNCTKKQYYFKAISFGLLYILLSLFSSSSLHKLLNAFQMKIKVKEKL